DDAGLLERARSELEAMPSARLRKKREPDDILAALRSLPGELQARAALAGRYRRALDRTGITHPAVPSGAPLWKYSILLPSRAERDRMTRELLAAGVQATNLYPPLAPFFPEARNPRTQDFPVAAHLDRKSVV